jgi:hypothetical protein
VSLRNNESRLIRRLSSISGFLVSIRKISICESVPVKIGHQLMNKVYQLTITQENDALGILMSEDE